MRAHAQHGLLDAVRWGDGDDGMTAPSSQEGGRRVLRLGHQPDDHITVGDNATDLVVLANNHVANNGGQWCGWNRSGAALPLQTWYRTRRGAYQC
jgi:hypothetical protein